MALLRMNFCAATRPRIQSIMRSFERVWNNLCKTVELPQASLCKRWPLHNFLPV